MTVKIFFQSITRALGKRKLPMNDESPKKRFRKNDYRPIITINNLPNEMLLEIFNHLDFATLLNANLVNKNWNRIILGTKLSDKISRLYVTAAKIDDSVPELTRNYRSIHFEGVIDWKVELINQLQIIGSQVTEVTFVETVFFTKDFRNLMQVFPNLKFMEISCCYEAVGLDETSYDYTKTEMKNLQSLSVRGYSWPLWFISTPNLKCLKLEMMGTADNDIIVPFLNNQTSLEALQLENINELFDARYGTVCPEFRLKELEMVNLPFADCTQVVSFLKCMQDSVVHLNLGLEMRPEISEYILQNFRKVVHMKIDYACFPKSKTFYREMNASKSLKYLDLYGNMASSLQIMRFLAKNPGVEELSLNSLRGLYTSRKSFWKHISKYVPRLKHLSLFRINIENMKYIRLSNLKHLDVDCIGYSTPDDWLQFCENNPNIERFHIFKTIEQYFVEIRKIIIEKLKKLNDFIEFSI